MPIAFLAPVFLAGLAAIAVPVVIHLANRPRKEAVPFPSLMFLERVEYRDATRRGLRDVALLALRILALVLVAAAFARPFLDRPDAPAVAVDGGREVVVLLDRSASMAVEGRMDEARAAVAEVAASLRRGDRATLVVFDQAAVAANRATDRAAVLRAAADSVRPGAGATRFAPALRLAESLLSGSPLPRREVVLVSDFQRAGWDADAAPRMPAGTRIRTVAVGGPVDNAAVTGVSVVRERFSGRDRARFRVRVANRGAAPFAAPVDLVVDGRPVGRREITVAPGDEAQVEIGPLTLGDARSRVAVRAGVDALPLDNTYHLVLEPGRAYRVLRVRPPGGGGPYLARALEVGGRHDVAEVGADRLDAGDLAGVDVVVLDGADPRGDDAARALRTFLAAGRGVVVVLGERSRAARWTGAAEGLLPGTLEGTRDRGDDGASLASLRYDHPILRPFREAPAGLTGARFYRYRELLPDPDAEVLARFDDGSAAVVVRSAGAGRVVVLTAPVDGRGSDLVLQPAFVPLIHEMVRHAAARESPPEWRTVGDLLDAGALLGGRAAHAGPAPAGAPGAGADAADTTGGATDAPTLLRGARLLTPSGARLAVEAGSLYRLEEAGFYELRDPRSTALPPVVAVNPDVSESALATVDPEVVRAGIAGGDAPAPVSFAVEDRERSQGLWWYALAAAFLIMVAETALANRLSRRPLPLEGRSP